MNVSSAKTKRLIRHTFLELLHEKKQLRKVSVSELVKRAELDRSTFYAHYSDIYEIAEEMQTEAISGVFVDRTIRTREDLLRFFRDMYACFGEHLEEYRMLLASDEPFAFLRRLRQMVLDKILENPTVIGNGEWQALKISMYVEGMTEEFIRFFRSQSRYSFDELCAGLMAVLESIV